MSYDEAFNTTVEQYVCYAHAYNISQCDKEYNAAVQAWFNQAVKATSGSAKKPTPKYRNFDDFFDRNKQFASLFSESKAKVQEKRLSLAERNRLLNDKEV